MKFPAGLGGKGNEGVTSLVRQNPGAIGYIEMTYAKVNNLPMAALRNKSGQFIEPSVEAVAAAAAGVKPTSDDLRLYASLIPPVSWRIRFVADLHFSQ